MIPPVVLVLWAMDPVVIFSSQQLADAIDNLFDPTSDIEQVIVLYGIQTNDVYAVSTLRMVTNVHPTPQTHWRVTKGEVNSAADGRRPVGIIHSHLLADDYLPSLNDLNSLPFGCIGAVWCFGTLNWYRSGSLEPDVEVRIANHSRSASAS